MPVFLRRKRKTVCLILNGSTLLFIYIKVVKKVFCLKEQVCMVYFAAVLR